MSAPDGWQLADAIVDDENPGRDTVMLTVRVRPLDGSDEFRATFPSEPASDVFSTPRIGETIPVQFRAKDRQVRIDVTEDRVRQNSIQRRRDRRAAEIAAANPYAQRRPAPERHSASAHHAPAPRHARAPVQPALDADADPLDLIAQLAELHASGDLTDEEFARMKAKLLASQ